VTKAFERVGTPDQRHRLTSRLHKRPQVVDAVAMIGVVVGDQHRIETPAIGGEQLLPEVRAAIDQQPLVRALDQQR
jgi:hypothetical protein